MMICENLHVLVCFGHLSFVSCTVRTLYLRRMGSLHLSLLNIMLIPCSPVYQQTVDSNLYSSAPSHHHCPPTFVPSINAKAGPWALTTQQVQSDCSNIIILRQNTFRLHIFCEIVNYKYSSINRIKPQKIHSSAWGKGIQKCRLFITCKDGYWPFRRGAETSVGNGLNRNTNIYFGLPSDSGHHYLNVDKPMMNVNGIMTYKYGYWLFREGPETSVGDIPNTDTNITVFWSSFWLGHHYLEVDKTLISVNGLMTELSCGKNMARALDFIHVLRRIQSKPVLKMHTSTYVAITLMLSAQLL